MDGEIGPLGLVGPLTGYQVLKKKILLIFLIQSGRPNSVLKWGFSSCIYNQVGLTLYET
jgi:hypothetical protein